MGSRGRFEVAVWGSLALALAGLVLLQLAACGGGGGKHQQQQQLPVTIAISTHPTTVNAGSNYSFAATVTNGTTNAVTWKLACAQGVSDCGSIGASTGIYKAPIVDGDISTTVTATSSDDVSKTDAWTFKVIPIAATVKIKTTPGWINAGLSLQFSATVTGRIDTTVTWTMACVAEGVTDCGTISPDGMYTAPVSVTAQTPFLVTATSNSDKTASDTTGIALLPPIAVAVSPASAQLVAGFSYPFAATVQNDMGYAGVAWDVNGVPGGNADVGTIAVVADALNPTHLVGLYTAPATAPSSAITVTATSLVDGKKSASSAVALMPNPHPNFKGNFALLVHGGAEGAGGVVNLDGAGKLTGKLDVHVGGPQDMVVPGLDVTGVYGFNGGDLGWATVTLSAAGQSLSWDFRLVFDSDTTATVMQFDGAGNMMGTIEQQGSDTASALTGKSVFALDGFQMNADLIGGKTFAVLGQMTGSGGALNMTYDVMDAASNHVSHAATGTYSVSGTSGTANLGVGDALGLKNSPDFFVYPVSSTRALVMTKTPPLLAGWLDGQSGDTFSTASLKGEWVFYSAGAPDFTSATLGRFVTDGTGTSGPGCDDAAGGSSFLPPACYPMFDLGQFTVDASGRGYAPSAQWGMPRPAYFYFIDADHGRFGTQGGLGEFYRVNGAPFTDATLQGTFTVAFSGVQDYFFNAKSDNQAGIAVFDGAGKVTMTTDWNDTRDFVQTEAYQRTGTYAFDAGIYATGERGMMVLGDDMQLVYYAISPDKMFMIQFADRDLAFGVARRSTQPAAQGARVASRR